MVAGAAEAVGQWRVSEAVVAMCVISGDLAHLALTGQGVAPDMTVLSAGALGTGR